VTNSAHDPANSGVVRVTRCLCRALQSGCNALFVIWDASIAAYVFPTVEEYRQLGAFNGPVRRANHLASPAGRRLRLNADYVERLPAGERWLLLTETTLEVHGRLIRETARKLGLRLAAVFYDAIPVLRPDLCQDTVIRDNHADYMTGLAECDVVLPISQFSARCLNDFWRRRQIAPTLVWPAALPEQFMAGPRLTRPQAPDSRGIRILCVSTLEPRKNHRTLLAAMQRVAALRPEVDWTLTLIGNRYAGADELAALVEAACAADPRIRWLGIADDTRLREEYENCSFTVYPSCIEGYGMPIVESLWHAKPCICHEQGVMAELAGAGGCLTTDVLDVDRLSDAILRLCTEPDLAARLARQAAGRRMRDWRAYAGALLTGMNAAGAQRTVLICCNVYPPRFIGGAELIAHEQARALQAAGWRTIVFTGDTEAQNQRHDMSHEVYEGVDVYRVFLTYEDFSPEFVNFAHPRVEEHFRALLARESPDVVHFHNLSGLSIRIIAMAKAAGTKTVLTLHDHWAFCFRNTLMKTPGVACRDFGACAECLAVINDGQERRIPMRLRRDYFALTMRDVDEFVSPSDYLAQTYVAAGFPRDRMHVIWNGVDTERFGRVTKIPAAGVTRVSFFGILSAHKGIAGLLHALPLLRHRSAVRVNLVGDGDEVPLYQQILAANGCADRVRFWGKLGNREVERAYAETDILVLPSIWRENQPVSITEAMAAGIPVIAARAGGIPELVEDGVTGLLFDAGEVAQLADRIDRLAGDPDLRARMGRAGALKMAPHGLAQQVRRLQRVYRSSGAAPAPCARDERVIICAGRRFSPAACAAIIAPRRAAAPLHWRFLHADWCEERLWSAAWLLLVVDPELAAADYGPVERSTLPLLLPRECAAVAGRLRDDGNVMLYGDAGELLRCLRQLEDEEAAYVGRVGAAAGLPA
jgi:glycosyltransferase involved in cell wall biosynthesis